MNKESFDITSILNRALDILFVLNPRGTSLGIFAGIIFHGIVKALQPLHSKLEYINLLALSHWHFIGFGVFLFNLPAFLTRNKIDPKIEEGLSYIRKQVELGTVTDWQSQQMYVNLHAKVLSSIVLNEKEEENRKKMEKILVDDINKK
ncbi:MAG: hypothetical protein D3909_10450 [Candidatus Electrothrix sp. ATG1]|nr:hypothetical protein [Candidatus Electrothrix sp. ATG1]